MSQQPHLGQHPVHLGRGGTVVPLPEFTGTPQWYMDYEDAGRADGTDGRLVSLHDFDASWDSWEVHPNGEELVVCVSGAATFVQEVDGQPVRVLLTAGQWLRNPAGVWHTADLEPGAAATCLFVTSGLGTAHRPR